MRITILFVLLACLAFSLVSASKGSSHQPGPRKPPGETGGQVVEAPKRVKRNHRNHLHYGYPLPALYYGRYGYPADLYL